MLEITFGSGRFRDYYNYHYLLLTYYFGFIVIKITYLIQLARVKGRSVA